MSILAQLIGQILDEKYEIERELGQGGMGAVYKAIHLGTKRPVALKVITPQFMANEQFVERFRREAEAAGRLRHPNVVNVTDFGFAHIGKERIAYLVMEYLDGCSLGDLLKRQPRLSLNFIVDITEQVCLAIDKAHQQGIIHRDLKPDNIWLEPNGRGGYHVKVLDFGLAKLRGPSGHTGKLSTNNIAGQNLINSAVKSVGMSSSPVKAASVVKGSIAAGDEAATDPLAEMPIGEIPTGEIPIDPEAQTQVQISVVASESRTHVMDSPQTVEEKAFSTQAAGNLTQVGMVLGTPIYMSPEQCLSRELDARSDIYSLGIILYEMLAGQTPFSGSAQHLMAQHINSAPPSLQEKRPDLAKSVADLTMSALAKQPDARPATAGAFANALRANIEGEVQILRQGKFYNSNFMLLFLSMAVIIFVPFMLGLMLLSLLLKPFAVDHAILCIGIFWPTHLLIMLLASKFNTAACALIVDRLRKAPLNPIKVSEIFLAFRLRLRVLFSVSILSMTSTLASLIKFIMPGVHKYLDHALIAPLVMLEDLHGKDVIARSQTLVDRLRALTLLLQIREFSVCLISLFFFSSVFSVTMALLGAANDDHYNILKMPGYLTIISCWYFFFLGHAAYVGIPLSLLYFRARQANGEILEEEEAESRQEERPKRRSQFSRATWAWMIVPIVMLMVIISYQFLAQQPNLITAVRSGSDKTVKRLLKSGVSVNTADFFGHTPLMIAAREGYSEILKQLYTAGAEVNARDSDGDSVLIYAARSGYADIVDFLIKVHAEINVANNDGETPLICAVKRGRPEVVAMLLKAGADVKLIDRTGKSAITYAEEEERRDIFDLLKKAPGK